MDDPDGNADFLTAIAADTLRICEAGEYTAPSGKTVVIREAARAALVGTRLVRSSSASVSRGSPRVSVTEEATAACAKRLLTAGHAHVAVLNFANGVHEGGGFLGGARAQEEQLCRCSALYPILTSGRAAPFYVEQCAAKTALVLDLVLASPFVPFFRDESFALLEEPFLASVLTSAAPSLGWLRAMVDSRKEPATRWNEIPDVFARRTRLVLSAAEKLGADALVLGAWGCGAFGNAPDLVAVKFREAVNERGGAFAEICFAIYRGPSENFASFRRAFP
jgi:uncharacterized protein (TIGR02452 family)